MLRMRFAPQTTLPAVLAGLPNMQGGHSPSQKFLPCGSGFQPRLDGPRQGDLLHNGASRGIHSVGRGPTISTISRRRLVHNAG